MIRVKAECAMKTRMCIAISVLYGIIDTQLGVPLFVGIMENPADG